MIWWIVGYIAIAALTFGFVAAMPTEASPKANAITSFSMGAFWPLTVFLIIGYAAFMCIDGWAAPHPGGK